MNQTEEYVPYFPVDVMQTLVIGIQEQMPEFVPERGTFCRAPAAMEAFQIQQI